MGRAGLDAICEEAAAAAGLDDFGDDWFLGPLAAWVDDLSQPSLNDFGRRFLRSLAVKDVARRLRVLDVLRRNPEIADVAIAPTLYITGQWRSGTTHLHHLLARHPVARALLRWELMEPVPPPEAGSHATDPRIAAVQGSVEKLRGSFLERMHWVNADEPEECAWGFIDAVAMLGHSASFCMPRWRRFLLEEDLTPAYAHYRSVVQLLLWKHPVPPDGRLVLKSPQIAVHLGAFAEVFPEAHFVVLDRDPFRCVVSAASMGQSIVGPFCDTNPIDNDGGRDRVALHWTGHLLRGMSEFSSLRPERVTHVAYPDLIADPAAASRGVFAAAGFPIDAGFAEKVAAYLEAQRAGGRPAPPAQLLTHGYTEDVVRSEPAVREYCDRFNVVPERERLVGVHS